MMKNCFFLLVLLSSYIIPHYAYGQSATRIREELIQYKTYPFSDPDPIASTQKLYPYFRFDGFSNKSELKSWKAVILENDFIRVQVMPEIGGKIWSAYDKVSKRDYIYNNGVVKFRDIAMRGPWTSGGIEANYGIIGHTPNTATPVDYLLQEHVDGSASCFIHAFDLLSRSNWTLEIRLEKDKGYFSTRSFWYNTNGVEQPYYTWMNLAVAANDELQFLYPGDKYIGHDGDTHQWPIDTEGRNLSFYKSNNFGGSKSYHVLGAHSNAFGVYYQDKDQGMMRYALREDKLGKKIFLWSQADEGRIWEDLLTDASGQYVEVQSGRLFNQNVASSSLTPFKQVGFAPYQSDSWTEYWMPFSGIGRPDEVHPTAAIKVDYRANNLRVVLDPKRVLQDSVHILDADGMLLASNFVKGSPGVPVTIEFGQSATKRSRYLKVGNDYFDILHPSSEKILDRPNQYLANQALDSNQIKLFEVRDFMRFRLYHEAEEKLNQITSVDALSLELLIERAKLAWFKMDYEDCYKYSKEAISIDTYHAHANYFYGLSASRLDRHYDALDGFEVATLDISMRGAAYIELAKYYYRIKDYSSAYAYSKKAEATNMHNIKALQLQYLATAKLGEDFSSSTRDRVRQNDPFNVFMQFEEKKEINLQQEFAAEQILELGIWYSELREFEKAKDVLRLIKYPNTEVLYWLAWLFRHDDTEESRKWIERAEQSNPAFVFPFREESAVVLDWAQKETIGSWKAAYLKALLYRFRNHHNLALKALVSVDPPKDFAAFYAVRAALEKKENLSQAIESMKEAVTIDSQQWRYRLLLTQMLNTNGQFKDALNTISLSKDKYPGNYIVELTAVRTLLLNEEYKKAEVLLSKMNILPFEGATESHRYFIQTKLMLAYAYLLDRKYKLAIEKITESRLWPENLGVGEPYQSEKNELLADWLQAYAMKESGDLEAERKYLEKVAENKKSTNLYENLLREQAFIKLGIKTTEERPIEGEDAKLQSLVREGKLDLYWPQIVNRIYLAQDRRMF